MTYTITRAIAAIKDGDPNKAIALLQNPELFFIEWSAEDVKQRYDDRVSDGETDLGDMLIDRLLYIMAMMDKYHDCTIGISWDTIDFWIDGTRDFGKEEPNDTTLQAGLR